ncbi:hypothetical protein RJT34_10258 [Clitoria ternatea]|uniref:RING-type domain-containing protein n=1 Tax=Clitoria ternatea TaxID=43366 RepID=A0AAN9K7U4_CLITE
MKSTVLISFSLVYCVAFSSEKEKEKKERRRERKGYQELGEARQRSLSSSALPSPSQRKRAPLPLFRFPNLKVVMVTTPLFMARPTHHVIDVTTSEQPSTSNHRIRPRGGVNDNDDDDVFDNSNSNNNMRRHRSPLNSGLWICVELVITMSQIVAAVLVLSLSRHEHPRAPLFAWIVGYTSGCVATLPLLFWRYYHNRHVQELGVSSTLSQTSPRRNYPSGGDHAPVSSFRSNRGSWLVNARLKLLVEYFRISIDCFFAIWFVVGNVWIFGGHSSADEAPNLYRLCVVFLTFSCIGYAMPFILCATICCCLPCIISVLSVREDMSQMRGATSESIDALPTYKFKRKKSISKDETNLDESNSTAGEGGIVAAGTEKERAISGEDAVCCICLSNYENNDELRELPCAHFFHKDCVDKWLKINALCPLCKSEVGENTGESVSREEASQNRVENALVNTPS